MQYPRAYRQQMIGLLVVVADDDEKGSLGGSQTSCA